MRSLLRIGGRRQSCRSRGGPPQLVDSRDLAIPRREALPPDDPGALGVVLQLEATAAAARGDAAAARAAARRRVQLTDEHGGRALARVAARLDLARVLEQVGPADSAADALAEARALAEEADEPSLVGAVELASKRRRSVPAS